MTRPHHLEFDRRYVLTGGAALLASSCASSPSQFANAARSPWDKAVGAFEHGDSDRTSIFADVDAFRMSGVAPAADRAPFPTPGLWSVAFDSRGAGFALHGVIGGAPGADRPRLSAFDPVTLNETWRIDLPIPEGPYWNYPGGIGAMADGSLIAAYATRLIRVDSMTGAIVRSLDLPAPAGMADTAYNGFIALSDGRLLLKSHHRKSNCPYAGYRALIECGVDGLPPSALLLVDAKDLRILWRGDAPEFIGGRISSARRKGRDLVYLAGATSLHRLIYDGRRLVPDLTWGPVRYCEGAETPGTAVVGFGDFVVAQNNAIPAKAPLRMTVVHQDDSTTRTSIQPFADRFDGVSFMPSKATADSASRRIYTSEAHGALAAIDFDPRDGLRVGWSAPVKSGSFITALGRPDARVLVASDIGSAAYDSLGAPIHEKERAVWLEASTGALLSEIAGLPRNFGLTLTPYADGSIFYATRAAGLWRLRPSRRT